LNQRLPCDWDPSLFPNRNGGARNLQGRGTLARSFVYAHEIVKCHGRIITLFRRLRKNPLTVRRLALNMFDMGLPSDYIEVVAWVRRA
jgi:hypothetical protein